MKTAAAVQLRETQDRLGPRRVDRDNCVIYGVKLCGLESDNGRVYTRECFADAIARGLYENVPFRRNHRSKESRDDRDVDDTVGMVRNVRQDADGTPRGDLFLLKSHELTPKLLEAAERELANPEDRFFGLSHDADRRSREFRDGVEVILALEEVRSVDLVADPATNKGLYESRRNKPVAKITRKQLWESCPARFDLKKRAAVKRLFEGMDEYGSANVPDMEADEPEKLSPDEHLAKGMKEACHAVVEDDEMSADDKHAKLKEILKAHEKLAGKGEETEADDDPDDDDTSDSAESRKLKKRVGELEAKDHCRELCESLRYVPSKAVLKALVLMESDDDRRAFVKEQRQAAGGGVTTQKPGGGSLRESRGDSVADLASPEAMAGAIRAGRFLPRN